MPVRLPEPCVRRIKRNLGRQIVFSIIAVILVLGACNIGLLAQKSEKSSRVVLTSVKPEYPAALQRLQVGGLVRLTVTVLASGTVSKVQVRGGNPILAECAVAAVMKWKYAPAPAETNEEVSLSFTPR